MGAPATQIAAHTRVIGDVSADGDVVVQGRVEGRIRAAGVVHLSASAEVHGDLEATRVIIDDGAVFEGQVRLLRAHATPLASTSPPVTPLTAPIARIVPELATPGRRRAQRRPA